jgi:hypothetical protein
MKTTQRFGLLVVLLFLSVKIFSQQLRLGNNPYTVEKSAVLELVSDNQGLLLPRIIDTASINSLNPPDGMVIYFTPAKLLLLRSNGTWKELTISGVTSLNGNTGALTMDTGYIANFYSKVRSLFSASAPTTYSNGTIGISQATTSTNGYLSSSDWNTFNNKLSSSRTISTTAPLTGGGDLTADRTFAISTNGISNSLIRQSAALSVIGNSTNVTANVGDIIAANDGEVLRRSGTTLGFGTIATAGITNSAVTYSKIQNVSTNNRLLGRATTGAGVVEEITLGTGLSYSGTTLNVGSLPNSALTNSSIALTLGTTGTDANVSGSPASLGGSLTLNLPSASPTNRGLLTSADWTTFNNKLSSVDTSNIANFYQKVRSEFSAGSGISYNSATGVISSTINTDNFWALGGNTAGALKNFGTTDNYTVGFITNNTERMRIDNLGRVGIGVTDPANPLVVKDTFEIRRVGSLSQLLFSNTAGSGNFRIASDGGDLFLQGGGGKVGQISSYWTTILAGDRRTSTSPSFINGSGNTGVLVQGQRDASVPLAIQANSATQTANLTEWRNSSGTALNVVDKNGKLGIGSLTPSEALDVTGNIRFTGAVTAGTWNGSIVQSAYGGTGNGFTKFTGPTTSEKTFTLPNASATILTDNAPVTIAQGGTGQTTATAAFDALAPTTTKGDLIIRNSTNNVRQAVGINGQFLIADPAQTTGIKWGSLHLASGQDATDINNSAASFQTTFANKLTVSFTPDATGDYVVDWSAEVMNETGNNEVIVRVQQAGTDIARGRYTVTVASAYSTLSGFSIRTLTASTTYSYTIDYASGVNGRTAHIRNTYLTIKKL